MDRRTDDLFDDWVEQMETAARIAGTFVDMKEAANE
jgi:hypothetical protein